MNSINTISGILLVSFALSVVACQADDASPDNTIVIPTSMTDTWQVTDVLFDQNDPRQGMGHKYLVPKYLGRIFKLTMDQLSINTSYEDLCENPRFIPRKMTASQIIGKSISTRMFSPSVPTAKDLQFPLAGNTSVNALYLACNGKIRAKDPGMIASADLSDAVWFISLEDDKLAMSWHEESILILSRLKDSTKPVASFDCAKAGTEVEKKICGSVGLAAYDRSLSQTYQQARDYYRSQKDSTAINELKDSQRAWIKQRNDCGNDVKCLEKTMSNRVSEIIYDLGDYMYQHR